MKEKILAQSEIIFNTLSKHGCQYLSIPELNWGCTIGKMRTYGNKPFRGILCEETNGGVQIAIIGSCPPNTPHGYLISHELLAMSTWQLSSYCRKLMWAAKKNEEAEERLRMLKTLKEFKQKANTATTIYESYLDSFQRKGYSL